MRDESGCLLAVWPNQPYRQNTLRAAPARRPPRRRLALPRRAAAENPDVEVVDDEGADTVHTGRIVPVYEKTGPLTPRMQRALVHEVLERLPPDVEDLLPA